MTNRINHDRADELEMLEQPSMALTVEYSEDIEGHGPLYRALDAQGNELCRCDRSNGWWVVCNEGRDGSRGGIVAQKESNVEALGVLVAYGMGVLAS